MSPSKIWRQGISTIASVSRRCCHSLVFHGTEEIAMSALRSERFATAAPTEADAKRARASSRQLATHKLGRKASVRIQVLDDGEPADPIAVPAAALRLFLYILTEMAQGSAVTLFPTPAEL